MTWRPRLPRQAHQPLRGGSRSAARRAAFLCAATLLAAGGAAGCGGQTAARPAGATESSPASTAAGRAYEAAAAAAARTREASDTRAAAIPAATLRAAEHPRLAAFPAARGRSLRALGALATHSVTLSASTGSFTPGTDRFAFALTTTSGAFLYDPTVVYLAPTPDAPAQGPFPAPADPMTVAPRYRSRQDSGPDALQAIDGAQLPLRQAGTYRILSLTQTSQGLIGATGEVAVSRSSQVPAVGERSPAITTDTEASVHGDTALLTTRVPAEHMNAVSLDRALGHRPIVLLFSTPALCISRVCGPVTDELVALQHRFGSRIDFIHQEIYVDNDPARGMRPQLHAFGLRTEPWLFAIDRRGRIVARLEGAFGRHTLTRALRAALR